MAASASLANYYNENIDYNLSKKIGKQIVKKTEDGFDTGEIGLLLNKLGFQKVIVITSNLDIFDYQWANFGNLRLTRTLEQAVKNRKYGERETAKTFIKFLKFSRKNSIVINYSFGKFIRAYLRKKKPLMVTFNWNMYFHVTKGDPFVGEYEEHVVVVHGYNSRGVYVCDSHNEMYKYRLKRYQSGFYIINWEHLMTVMGAGMGDVIIPLDFVKNENSS